MKAIMEQGKNSEKNLENHICRKEKNMNKVILSGRICADPEVRYTQGATPTAVARYRLAVDRRFKKEGEQTADFIGCVAFGKQGEFVEKYLRKGMKILVTGRIQTGNYTNKDGQKVYTTDIVVDEHEFCESKSNETSAPAQTPTAGAEFMQVPDDLDDLPFV